MGASGDGKGKETAIAGETDDSDLVLVMQKEMGAPIGARLKCAKRRVGGSTSKLQRDHSISANGHGDIEKQRLTRNGSLQSTTSALMRYFATWSQLAGARHPADVERFPPPARLSF